MQTNEFACGCNCVLRSSLTRPGLPLALYSSYPSYIIKEKLNLHKAATMPPRTLFISFFFFIF